MAERPPSFQWYPRDFAAAMHQLGASDEVELAYRRALDASWDEGCYGVGTPEQWIAWSRVKPEHQAQLELILAKVSQAQANGELVQMRMVRDRMEQALRHQSARKRGAAGGRKSMGGKRRKPRQAQLKQTQPHSSASASASASAVESKDTPTDGALVREWDSAFDEHFWPAYPRRVSKGAAREAWVRLRPPTPEIGTYSVLAGRIVAGLEWYVEGEWASRPEDKIPHAATWLNQKRWEDAFDGLGEAEAEA